MLKRSIALVAFGALLGAASCAAETDTDSGRQPGIRVGGTSGNGGTPDSGAGVGGATGHGGANGSGGGGEGGSSGALGSGGTDGSGGALGSGGAAGSAGSSGSAGTVGAAGSAGSSGSAGSNGSAGTSGTAGTNGASGTSGLAGTGGTSGTSGTAGTGGISGTAGTGGTSGTAGTGGTGGTDNRPPCLKNPNQVISIGDSYMNWGTHTFPQDLNAAAGVTFRPTYAIGGFSMATGGLGLIPPQFDTAVQQNPDIIAVVMTGGGNDVLIPALGRPDCKNMQNSGSVAGCQAIVTDALAAAERLMNKMVAAGVHDVIYYFYPHVPQPTLLGGNYPNSMLDYALPRVQEFCDSVGTRTQGKGFCWFVNTVPLFEGHPEYFAPADIHENSTGSKVIAKAVVDMMKAKCIAQPVSSGCCKP